MDKVLVIIPAYNEALNIERVVGNLTENYPFYDFVVVNDGSTDQTGEICRRDVYKRQVHCVFLFSEKGSEIIHSIGKIRIVRDKNNTVLVD